MLAGNMKLKHFLLIVCALGAAGTGGALLMCSDDTPERRTPDEEVAVKTPVSDPTPTPVMEEPADPPPQEDSLRPVDRELLRWVGKDLGSKKIKDAAIGRAWKINLYQDSGSAVLSRAKIDLNRNDRWDEKWTFDGTNISRKVSPSDDEDYSQEFDWNGSDWVAR